MSAVLIGMMGSGKTTLGKEAAAHARLRFEDLDTLVERRERLTIAELFAERGEAAFRELESEVLGRLEPDERLLLSVGGGAPLTPSNWAALTELGSIIYLRATVETLAERLRGTEAARPLLDAGNLEVSLGKLLRERRAAYERADVILDVERLSRSEIVHRIAKIAEAHRP